MQGTWSGGDLIFLVVLDDMRDIYIKRGITPMHSWRGKQSSLFQFHHLQGASSSSEQRENPVFGTPTRLCGVGGRVDGPHLGNQGFPCRPGDARLFPRAELGGLVGFVCVAFSANSIAESEDSAASLQVYEL